VAVLRKKVEEMRGQVKAMGLAPSGPTSDGEAPIGGNDLAGQLSFTAARQGRPPALPSPGEPERRGNTDCGYRFSVPWLEAISAAMPLTYAYDALARVAGDGALGVEFGRDLAVIVGAGLAALALGALTLRRRTP